MEVAARTTVPVKGKAMVKFRWGMRIPSEMKSSLGGIGDPKTGISLSKILFLVMDKIAIEHVDSNDSKQAISTAGKTGQNSDVAEACYTVKCQLEALQSENGLLKRAVEDLRREISGGRFGEIDRNDISKSKTERRNSEKKSMEEDLNEELRKALKGVASS